MTLILMNILAYLAILAVLGMIGAIVSAVLTARQIVAKAKYAGSLVKPHRQSVLQTVGIVKGIAAQSRVRLVAVKDHAKAAASTVMAAKVEIVSVAKTVDLGAATAEVKDAAAGLSSGSEAAAFIRQMLQTLRQAAPDDAG